MSYIAGCIIFLLIIFIPAAAVVIGTLYVQWLDNQEKECYYYRYCWDRFMKEGGFQIWEK